jgi:hypothetical protein
MIKLRTILIFLIAALLSGAEAFSLPANPAGKTDLNPEKMKKITGEICDIFVSGKSDNLRKYISRDWLREKDLDVQDYKINNYSPKYYDIHYAGGDICVTTIGGDGWMHLVIFKFINETGVYRVVPRGFADSNKEYIDPWWYVSSYIDKKQDEDK